MIRTGKHAGLLIVNWLPCQPVDQLGDEEEQHDPGEHDQKETFREEAPLDGAEEKDARDHGYDAEGDSPDSHRPVDLPLGHQSPALSVNEFGQRQSFSMHSLLSRMANRKHCYRSNVGGEVQRGGCLVLVECTDPYASQALAVKV